MNPLEKAWAVLKEEGPHIVWVTPEKRMGWVDGHGPYTSESIYAALKEQGTWDNRTESISDTYHWKKYANIRSQEDKLNPETYEEYQALTPEEKSEGFAQWFNQNITGKKINCEDNSHEEGWSYCGKPECESCGGRE